MKKRFRLLLIFSMGVTLILGITILRHRILTASFGDEFNDLKKVNFDCMHPWEGTPNLRVLSYNTDEAVVYYFTEDGGEKALFVKKDGQWRYKKTLAIWSANGGSADDYFVGPYFKHYVP